MRRERMRARGPRHTHGLVQMVREQVAVMMESMGKVASSVDALRRDVGELQVNVAQLGGSLNAVAEAWEDVEARVAKLEKKAKKP